VKFRGNSEGKKTTIRGKRLGWIPR